MASGSLQSIIEHLSKKTIPNLVNRGTLGGCYATSLGAALHELGHVFDLVHSDRGIMARGFEEVDIFFTVGNPQRGLQRGIFSFKTLEVNLYLYSLNILVEGRNRGQEICVRTRSPTKVTSVNFGFRSSRSDNEQDRDGQAYFHRSAAVLLAGHP